MLCHNVGGVGHYSIDNDQEKNTVNPYIHHWGPFMDSARIFLSLKKDKNGAKVKGHVYIMVWYGTIPYPHPFLTVKLLHHN